jgi:hypothetical protein
LDGIFLAFLIRLFSSTTVLPSLFVLVGFIIFSFVVPSKNLEPVLLDLNDYNPGVKGSPRNPIPFNDPSSPYGCQPGICVYEPSVFFIPETSELYYMCGRRAFLLPPQDCSISESPDLVGRITAAGAKGTPLDVDDVTQSSLALPETAKSFAASQYGAIFYTHDQRSILPSGSLYNETALNVCEFRPDGNYSSTASYCSSFGGVGYIIQYNFTALHVSPLYQTLADEALAREALNNDEFTISTTIAPLPITVSESQYVAADNAFAAWFLVRYVFIVCEFD